MDASPTPPIAVTGTAARLMERCDELLIEHPNAERTGIAPGFKAFRDWIEIILGRFKSPIGLPRFVRRNTHRGA